MFSLFSRKAKAPVTPTLPPCQEVAELLAYARNNKIELDDVYLDVLFEYLQTDCDPGNKNKNYKYEGN